MIELATFTCCRCDAQHRGPANQLPAGWQLVDGAAICPDCSHDRRAVRGHNTGSRDYVRSETALPLLSGSYIDLADPDCRLVQPVDIAAGLRQPRYSAQTRQFYTIAQHSLMVLRLVSPAARSLGGEKGLQLRRCALMHDAAEALIHDITAPLKRQLPDYRAIEARLEGRLGKRFGFEWTDWRRDQVKLADLQALAIEQRDLVGNVDAWPILDRIDRDQLADITIGRCWHPDEAMDRFLAAFKGLFPTEERAAA